MATRGQVPGSCCTDAGARRSRCCSCIPAARSGRTKDDGAWSIPKGEFDAARSAGRGGAARIRRRDRASTRAPPWSARRGRAVAREGRARLRRRGRSRPSARSAATPSSSNGRRARAACRRFPRSTAPAGSRSTKRARRSSRASGRSSTRWRARSSRSDAADRAFAMLALTPICTAPSAIRPLAPFIAARSRRAGCAVLRCGSSARGWRRSRRCSRRAFRRTAAGRCRGCCSSRTRPAPRGGCTLIVLTSSGRASSSSSVIQTVSVAMPRAISAFVSRSMLRGVEQAHVDVEIEPRLVGRDVAAGDRRDDDARHHVQRRMQAHQRVAALPVDLERRASRRRRARGAPRRSTCSTLSGASPLRVSTIAIRSPFARTSTPVSPTCPPPCG